MLVLSRKESESILVGDNIRITVIAAADGRARIGIDAPRHVHILRQELSPDHYPRDVHKTSAAAGTKSNGIEPEGAEEEASMDAQGLLDAGACPALAAAPLAGLINCR